MRRYLLTAIAFLFAGNVQAEGQSVWLKSFKVVRPPAQVQRFCVAFPEECAAQHSQTRFRLTFARRLELEVINRTVNDTMVYVKDPTDDDGIDDHWTLDPLQGDCEEFANYKRRRLMQLGWPASALLITVVRTVKGNMHATLTARTSAGDFVLDKTTPGPDPVQRWYQTGYEYVARQSEHDPTQWVSLVASATDNDFQVQSWTSSE